MEQPREVTPDTIEQARELIRQVREHLTAGSLDPALDIFRDLHPADQAELLGELSQEQQRGLLSALDVETSARILEHMEPEDAAKVFGEVEAPALSDILDEAPPDVAADLLKQLPEEQSPADAGGDGRAPGRGTPPGVRGRNRRRYHDHRLHFGAGRYDGGAGAGPSTHRGPRDGERRIDPRRVPRGQACRVLGPGPARPGSARSGGRRDHGTGGAFGSLRDRPGGVRPHSKAIRPPVSARCRPGNNALLVSFCWKTWWTSWKKKPPRTCIGLPDWATKGCLARCRARSVGAYRGFT